MNVKLRAAALAIAAASLIGVFASCNSGDNGEVTNSEGDVTYETSTPLDLSKIELPFDGIDLTKYVKLGQYKGIEVERPDTSVADEEVEEQIKSYMAAYVTNEPVTDRGAELGDTVLIDYVGTRDGEKFDGGSATDIDLVLGSSSYIDGFESGLVGAKPGEHVTLNLKFPEIYSNAPELAGKDVVFEVDVKKITTPVYPELDDVIASELSTTAKTAEEYRAEVRAALVDQKEYNADAYIYQTVWAAVKYNAEILDYPEARVSYYVSQVMDYYTQIAENSGTTLELLLSNNNLTMDDIRNEATSYANDSVAEELVLYAIADAENLVIDEQEYQTRVVEYVETYGYPSIAEFEASYDPSMIVQSMYWDLVIDYLISTLS